MDAGLDAPAQTRALEGNLTLELAAETAERLAQFIEVLEPIREQERAVVVG